MNWLRKNLSWSNIVAAFFAFIALVAVIPYEQGWVSTIFPPQVKPWLPPICGLCAFFVRAAKRSTRRNEDDPPAAVVINCVNYYNGTKG